MAFTELKFPSIIELIDFSLVMKVKTYEVNRLQNTIKGEFSKEDIDYAVKGFNAKVLPLSEKKDSRIF